MINFNLFKSIENCTGISSYSFDKVIQKGYIIYSNESGTYIVNSKSFTEITNTRVDWFDIIEIEDNFFYVYNRELFKINFKSLIVEKIYSTTEEALFPFSQDIVSVGSSNWRTKTQNFSLIKLPNQELLKWEDKRELLCISNEISVFYDGETQELFGIELNGKEENWRLPFNNSISGRRYYQLLYNEECIIQRHFEIQNNNLLKLNLNTGVIIWEIESAFSFYNFDELNNKLYGINGKTFEIINVESGIRELQIELEENLYIASHLTYYVDGYLYFSGYRDNNIPVFGAVDVKTGELVFTQTVEMPGEKSFKKGLDRPVVVGNRLYVRDAMKTLHIYERGS